MGRLLVAEGCSLRVIDLPFGQEKGVDDFIVAKGQPAFDALVLYLADNADLSYVDQNFQPESLQTWGKRGSVINAEMRRYRESVLGGLVEDGYTVIDADDASDDESKAVIESVKAASEELYTAECEAIANSPTIC